LSFLRSGNDNDEFNLDDDDEKEGDEVNDFSSTGNISSDDAKIDDNIVANNEDHKRYVLKTVSANFDDIRIHNTIES
jgi:hypothetical protein